MSRISRRTVVGSAAAFAFAPAIVGGSSLRALVTGLNRIGVKPPGIIAILQAIKTAGALQADLVIQ